MVRKGGFEPPRLSAPPPQDGVSASSTTSARIPMRQLTTGTGSEGDCDEPISTRMPRSGTHNAQCLQCYRVPPPAATSGLSLPRMRAAAIAPDPILPTLGRDSYALREWAEDRTHKDFRGRCGNCAQFPQPRE